jgi:hypothetical protein
MNPGPGKCKGCGAAILWITTVNGKAMCCDPDPLSIVPSKLGSTTAVTEDGRTIRGHSGPSIDSKRTPDAIEAFTPHWATCPAAAAFRKRRIDVGPSTKGDYE